MHRARGQICAVVLNMQNMPAMEDGHDAKQNMQNNFLSTHCRLVTDWSGGKRRQAVDRFHFDYVRPLGCQFGLTKMCVFYIYSLSSSSCHIIATFAAFDNIRIRLKYLQKYVFCENFGSRRSEDLICISLHF